MSPLGRGRRARRIAAVAAAAVIALFAAVPSPAHAGSEQGRLNVAIFNLPVGVTGAEWVLVDKCGKIPTAQGHDAWVVSAPGATWANVAASALSEPAMSVGFFDGACNFLGGNSSATRNVSASVAPGRTRWVYVWATNGANITFTVNWG